MRAHSIRALLVVIVAALAVFALLSILAPRDAAAYVHNGCKFPGSNPKIEYTGTLSSGWADHFDSGQAKWDAATPGYGGYFAPVSGSDHELQLFTGYYQWNTWRGLATGGCDAGGGQPWYNDLVTLRFNLSTTGSLDSTDKVGVVVHELGHSLGLAHSSLGCPAPGPVIMRSDSTWARTNCGVSSPPYNNDVLGVDALY
jgi:hypothetical protein